MICHEDWVAHRRVTSFVFFPSSSCLMWKVNKAPANKRIGNRLMGVSCGLPVYLCTTHAQRCQILRRFPILPLSTRGPQSICFGTLLCWGSLRWDRLFGILYGFKSLPQLMFGGPRHGNSVSSPYLMLKRQKSRIYFFCDALLCRSLLPNVGSLNEKESRFYHWTRKTIVVALQ